MNLSIGELAYVDYGEGPPQVVHCRLILDVVDLGGSEYIIGTPDFDVYSEVLDPTVNGDIVRVWRGRPNGALPAGLPGNRVYGFAPLTAAQALGELHLPLQRIVPGADLVVLGDYGLCKLSGTDNVERPCLVRQIADDDLPGFCDERILLARSSESCEGQERSVAEDVRTLEVRYAYNGERQRNFRESVRELSMTEFEDWPLEPRTTLEYARAISGIAESATAQHHIWVNSSGIPPGDRSVYEDQLLARVLDTALCYDSLNIANLACMELVCRRRQLLADAHSSSPGAPSYLGAEHYLGETYKQGGGIVVPSLTDFVSKKMQAQSQIMKEKRKLAEATSSGKGGKKGQPNPKNPPPAKAGGGNA
eukprot:Skav214230  [mRNA]  locus=scaffold1133:5725:6880:+ [translate_table: standard]